jgi:cell fate regulator YaaT (PSP1 superfamily)
MSCKTCSSASGGVPAGCKSNGNCMTDGGCGKLDVFDWLADIETGNFNQAFPIVEVRFKGSRKEFYKNMDHIYLELGDPVMVESTSSGADLGHVTLTGELVRNQLKKKGHSLEDPFKKIYRKANIQDIERWKVAKTLEKDTMYKARKIALSLNLSMKLSDVEYQGDKSKATFFYTADERVDFRELIKLLADEFKVRIEMRQIGMRQEASRLGGIGSCGRELCCSTWLTEFKTVATSTARYQNLSLNTLKLAGQCGKLKCCLNFELDSYMDALKDIPQKAEHLETEKGRARLQKTDIFKKMMWFSFVGEENWIPLPIQKVKEILEMNTRGEKPEHLISEVKEDKMLAPRVLDYENVVGKDSITRLDDRNKKKNRKKWHKSK